MRYYHPDTYESDYGESYLYSASCPNIEGGLEDDDYIGNYPLETREYMRH
jgi:hypothetical protein